MLIVITDISLSFLYFLFLTSYDLRIHWPSGKKIAALQMLHKVDPEVAALWLSAASKPPSYTNDSLGYDFFVPSAGSNLCDAVGLSSSISGGGGDGDVGDDGDVGASDCQRARKRKREEVIAIVAVDGSAATSGVGTSGGTSMDPQHHPERIFQGHSNQPRGEIRLFIEAKGSVRPWKDGFLLSEHEKKVAAYCAGPGPATTDTRGREEGQGYGQGHVKGQPTGRPHYRVAFISSLRLGLLPACISFLRSAQAQARPQPQASFQTLAAAAQAAERAAVVAAKTSSSSASASALALGVDTAELQRVIQLSWVDLQHCTLDTASVTYRAVPAYRQQARP